MKRINLLFIILFIILIYSCVSVDDSDNLPQPEEFAREEYIVPQGDPELVVQLGHRKGIKGLNISRDGRFLISASDDETLKLWDVASGKEMRTFTGHNRMVNDAVFSPDGKYIASCCGGAWNEQLFLWDARTGEKLKTFLCENAIDINCVDYSPDGKFLITGNGLIGYSRENYIGIWDVETVKRINKLEGHAKRIIDVEYSEDGKSILSAGEDNTIRLWDLGTAKLKCLFGEYTSYGNGLCFSPDGSYIASGTGGMQLVLWDIESGESVKRFYGFHTYINCIAFSPDGERITAGGIASDGGSGSIGEAMIFSLKTGKIIKRLNGITKGINDLCFTPDGRKILGASLEKTVREWDTESGELLRELPGHSGWVRGISFFPDNKRFLTWGYKGFDYAEIFLWDYETGEVINKYRQYSEGYASDRGRLSISPDGKSFLLALPTKNEVSVWDMESGEKIQELAGHIDGVQDVVYSPDGLRAASASLDSTIRIWDLKTGTYVAFLSRNQENDWLIFTHDNY